MIGIIGAMDIEVDGFKKHIQDCKIREVSGIKFYSGKLYEKDVVLCKSGEGKVNAAIAAQAMIMTYKPDFIVNSGVAGGLHSNMKAMDIAIANDVCQHDFDVTALGYKPGFLFQIEDVKINCDEKLISAIEECTRKICKNNIFKGTIASGDQFIASKEQKLKIRNTFDAIASEMEGGSIGHVCALNNVKFTVLRVISDNADGSADMSYEAFAEKASETSVNIMLEFVKNI